VRAVRTLCARCEHAAATACALWKRHGRCKDAVGTSCGRCRDAMRTLCTRYNWQIWYFYVYSAAIPQRADMVLERCTNAVATPFGVTGALRTELRLNVINIPGYIQTLKRTACILHELCSGTAQNDEGIGVITNLLDTRFEDNAPFRKISNFFCFDLVKACERVFPLCFLGQIVTWQFNPNLLDTNWPCTVINDNDWHLRNGPSHARFVSN